MSPHGEDLVVRLLHDQTNRIAELHSAQDKTTVALIRVETRLADLEGTCHVRHREVDRRLDGLETFEEDTGNHNIAELQGKLNERNDWRKWAVRTVGAALFMAALGGWWSKLTTCGSAHAQPAQGMVAR